MIARHDYLHTLDSKKDSNLNMIGTFDLSSTLPDGYPLVDTTPLPSTWLMLISGFLGLGYFAYRGTKKRTALAAA